MHFKFETLTIEWSKKNLTFKKRDKKIFSFGLFILIIDWVGLIQISRILYEIYMKICESVKILLFEAY